MLVLDAATSRLPSHAVGEAAARGGVDAIHVRGCASDRAAFELTSRLVADLAGLPTRVVVNERFDIAVAAGAHGVHLKDRGLSPREVREAAHAIGARPGFLVAVAVHDDAGLRRAASTGADWCTLSPFRSAHGRAGLGEDGLRALLQGSHGADSACPWVLLGGVQEGDEAVAARLGPARWGLAAVRALQDAPSLAVVEARARRWRAGIEAAAASGPRPACC
jgi:thiamine-phosphate pyrophosphorylase